MKSALTTKLQNSVIKEKKIDKALKKYTDGKVSIGKAAEITGISLRDMLALLSKRGITFNYSLESLRNDFKEAVK